MYLFLNMLICYLQIKLYFICKPNHVFYQNHRLKILCYLCISVFSTNYVYLFLTNVYLIRLVKDIGYLLDFSAYPISDSED